MKIQVPLVVVFIIILVLFSTQSWIFLQRSNSALLQSISEESIFYAENRINEIDSFIADRLEEVRLFTRIPEVQTALRKSNEEFSAMTDIGATLAERDEVWPMLGATSSFVADLFKSPLSEQIKNTLIRFGDEQYAFKIYSEIFVTNKYGAIAGLSNLTSDYNQADEDWWVRARDEGAFAGEVSFDESAGLYSIPLHIPIVDEANNFIGVVKTVLALRTIVRYTFLANGLYDSTVVELLDKEKRVLYSNVNHKIFADRSHIYNLNTDEAYAQTFIDNEQLVVFAKSDGSGEYTGLGWIFVARHDTKEALKPLASLSIFTLIMSTIIIGIIILTGIGIIWFVSRLQKKIRLATEKITDLAKIPAENPNPIMRVTRDYTVLYANNISRKLLKQWGVSPGQKLPTKISQLIEPALKQKTKKPVEFTVGNAYYECLFYSPDNEEYINLYLWDVTKEKAVDRAKTEFVSLASHQLRTPLSIINWHSEMLSDPKVGKLNKKQKEYLNEVREGSFRMTKLVGALLNATRLDLGTYKIEPEPVELKTLFTDLEKQYAPTIKDKRLTFKLKLPTKLKTVTADKTIIRLIFDNLISNAVKYSRPKGSITVSVTDFGVQKFKVSVADRGYGIPKNQQKEIFTKMFRADNVASLDTTGTGLGLYMVKAIINSLGGTITFKSKLNQGTTFTVTLPKKIKLKKGSSRFA